MTHADELGAADAEAQKSFDDLDHATYWNFRRGFDSQMTVEALVDISNDPRNHPLRRKAALDEAESRLGC